MARHYVTSDPFGANRRIEVAARQYAERIVYGGVMYIGGGALVLILLIVLVVLVMRRA